MTIQDSGRLFWPLLLLYQRVTDIPSTSRVGFCFFYSVFVCKVSSFSSFVHPFVPSILYLRSPALQHRQCAWPTAEDYRRFLFVYWTDRGTPKEIQSNRLRARHETPDGDYDFFCESREYHGGCVLNCCYLNTQLVGWIQDITLFVQTFFLTLHDRPQVTKSFFSWISLQGGLRLIGDMVDCIKDVEFFSGYTQRKKSEEKERKKGFSFHSVGSSGSNSQDNARRHLGRWRWLDWIVIVK